MSTSFKNLKQKKNKIIGVICCVPVNHSNFFKTQKYDLEYFGMSFSQRIIAFVACLGVGALLFFYSFTRLLTSIVNPAGFALPYALSNTIFFLMFGFISGFKSYMSNLFSSSKRMFTLSFLSSTFFTLYSSLFFKSYLLNLAMMFLQVVVFLGFALTFLPGGASGVSSLLGVFFKR